ncbi:MAG TPA: DMT family transporter [Glycomyces sp.]|nr:DMT family transporter [Glycomyces sp.]
MTERGATMKGAAFGVTAMITVGSSASVLAALGDYPTFGGQAIRYAGAAVILLILLRVLRIAHMRGTAPDWLRLTLLAATGLAGFNVCYVEAVRHADPATVGAIIGGVPIVMAVLDPILRRRAPSSRLIAAAAVVSVGVAVMQGFGGGSVLGLLWALGALAAEVAFTLLAVPLLPKYGPMRVSAYASVLSVPLLLLAGFLVDGRAALPVPDATQTVAFAYLAVVVTALAFVLWYSAVGRLGADRAGLCAGIAPVSSVFAAWLIATGNPSTADLVGAVLVGLGVLVGLMPAATPPEAAGTLTRRPIGRSRRSGL